MLREKGDPEGALEALEHVTMFDDNHVGALALTGEIFIRRGMFAEAAEKLARLATVEAAPPKNRDHRRRRGGRPLREQAGSPRPRARGAARAPQREAHDAPRPRAARARRGSHGLVGRGDAHPRGAHERAPRARRAHRGGAPRDRDPSRPPPRRRTGAVERGRRSSSRSRRATARRSTSSSASIRASRSAQALLERGRDAILLMRSTSRPGISRLSDGSRASRTRSATAASSSRRSRARSLSAVRTARASR